MIKIITATLISASAATAAMAAPLPAPPTEVYTAPVHNTCADKVLNLYFKSGEIVLTDEAKAVIAEASEMLNGCIIGDVSLEASAVDALNGDVQNELMSSRIATVAAELNEEGLSGQRLKANLAVTVLPALYNLPADRAVEVRLTAWAPTIG